MSNSSVFPTFPKYIYFTEVPPSQWRPLVLRTRNSVGSPERLLCVSAVDCESEEIQVGSGNMHTLTSAP